VDEKLVLGVDCGTQSLRAAFYRTDGTLLAHASCPYPTNRPQVNWAEQNPMDWWEALCRAVPECIAKANVDAADVAAIACDGTSYTGVFCTNDGRPLRPALLWMDLRAADEARRVEATAHPALDSCGRRISAEWLLPKTLWVRDHEPDIYAASDRILEGVDWLIHRLCGRWATSNSNASGKRHWRPETGWPAEFYASIGLEDLPAKSPDDVAYLGESLGPLTPESADVLGLPRTCIVSHGGMDGWTSAVGLNCFAPGSASLTLGTSNVVVVDTDTPQPIDGVMGPFPDGLRRGCHTYEAGQTSGAVIVGWLMDLLGRGQDAAAHAQLAHDATAIPPGSDGLVIFDAWRGNRTPYFDPLARGNICGLTLEHGPAHLYRAVLEGCSYGIRNVTETLERGGCRIDEFRACGSGTDNSLWMRILASITGKPIRVSREKDATCLGSAICAAVASGAYTDLEAAATAMAPPFTTIDPGPNHAAYDQYFSLYLDTYQDLRDTMHHLARLT